MHTHTYSVQFRISGINLNPSIVTEKLGIEPCQVREVSKSGIYKRKRTPFWAYDGFSVMSDHTREWRSLDDGLFLLLGTLMPKRDLIISNFSEFDMYWWCGHFQSSFDGGPMFSVKLLKELADFSVPLYLDNYFSED